MTGVDRESPRVLRDGCWVRDPATGIQRWHAAPDRRHPHWFVDCPRCEAPVGEMCKEPSGKPARHPHARRIEAHRHQAASALSPTSGGQR